MKYKIVSLCLGVLILLNACEEERWGNIPNLNEHVGAITLIDVNEEKSFFNALNDLAGQEVEFEINVDGFEVTEINNVDVELTFTENDATVDAEGNPADVTYDPVIIQTVETFPSTLAVSVEDVIAAIQTFKPDFTIADLEVGDQFNLTFPINTADGRRLTTALNSDLCQEPVQPSFGGCNVAWAVQCPSNIPVEDVTYRAETFVESTCCGLPTGELTKSGITIENEGSGVYIISDIASGAVQPFIEVIPVQIIDVCGNLSLGFEGGLDMASGGPEAPTYDEATGEWTIPFNNAGNGIVGVTKLIPEE
jgi:hypothetical protein